MADNTFDSIDLEEELRADLQFIRERMEREEIDFPESLKAENLMKRFAQELDGECGEEDPENVVDLEDVRPKKHRNGWTPWLTIAACFVLVFGAYRLMGGSEDSTSGGVVEQPNASPALLSSQNDGGESMPVAASYTEIYEAMKGLRNQQSVYYRSGGGQAEGAAMDGGVTNDLAGAPMPQAAPQEAMKSSPTAGGGDTGVYQTNVQTNGIDESDVIKTDGKYIYQYRFDSSTGGAQVAIVGATNLRLLSTIELPEYSWAELYLAEDQMVVLQSVGQEDLKKITSKMDVTLSSIVEMETLESSAKIDGTAASSSNGGYLEMTEAIVFDLSDHANPKEVKRFSQDGSYVSSRLYQDTLYLVTNKSSSQCDFDDGTSPARDLVPVLYDGDEVSLLAAENIIIPPYMENLSYSVVSSMDLTTKQVDTKAVLGSSDEVYMSSQNLYIVTPPDRFSMARSGKDGAYTGMVRFSLGAGKVTYAASGTVPGYINDQFSLDEYDGNLRVATTVFDSDRGETVNNLYLLDSQFNTVGELLDLAPGETIKAVRYFGKTAYVVTFEQTDPLFVIDLSDPKKPKVTGELKIPGFSEYLHPLDDHTLIGFGRNTTMTQRGGVVEDGLKLSLFDVSDPKNPRETDQLLIGNMGTSSEATRNHKAFLFYPQKKLVGFPVTVYTTKGGQAGDPWSGERSLSFAGYLVVGVGEDGFEILGSLANETSSEGYQRQDYDNIISRGIYIGETFYTSSNNSITAYSLSDFSKIGELTY